MSPLWGPALGLLAVVAVAALAGRWLLERPQRGLLLLAALVPFDGLLIIVPHPGFVEGWKEALVLATLGASVLARGRLPERERGAGWDRSVGRPLPSWAGPLGALVALGAVSCLAAPSGQAVIGMKVSFFFVLVALAAWLCPFTARDRDRLVTILMVTGFVTSVVGLAQRAVGAEALVRLGYDYNSEVRFAGDQLRAFSTFNQPFPFALFVMTVLLVAVPVALSDSRRWRNRLFLAVTPVLVLGMLSAVVRAALLGSVIGAAWLLVRNRRSLVRFATPVLLALLLVPASVRSDLMSASSLDERRAGWTQVATELLSSPFGNGIGTTGSAAEKALEDEDEDATDPDEALPDPTEDDAYQPDNYYVKTWLELGPLGLWLFLWFLALAFGHGRRVGAAATGQDAALAHGITAGVLAAAAAATVATYWEIFPVDVLFWLLQGVLTSTATHRTLSSSTPWPSGPVEEVSRPTSASSSAPCAP